MRRSLGQQGCSSDTCLRRLSSSSACQPSGYAWLTRHLFAQIIVEFRMSTVRIRLADTLAEVDFEADAVLLDGDFVRVDYGFVTRDKRGGEWILHLSFSPFFFFFQPLNPLPSSFLVLAFSLISSCLTNRANFSLGELLCLFCGPPRARCMPYIYAHEHKVAASSIYVHIDYVCTV